MAPTTLLEAPKPVSGLSKNTRPVSKLPLPKGIRIDWPAALFLSGVHLIALFGFFTFSWQALALCLVLHWITGGLGITLGFHRLLTHRSFKTPKWIEYTLAFIGTLAHQSGPVTWVAVHRLHHLKSDQEGDPHSPLVSFFWSHMGWCMMTNKELDTKDGKHRYAPDLARDPVFNFLEKTQLLWSFILGVGLYAWGGWPFVIWGIFVRLVLVYHSTWLVNSAAHVWGYRTYDAKDRSTNLWWVALLTYGEGWHNNHHAFQSSARHGLRLWEVDTTYWVIKALKWARLATDIRIPTAHQLAIKTTASA